MRWLFLIAGLSVGVVLGGIFGYHEGSQFKVDGARAEQPSPTPAMDRVPGASPISAHVYFSGQFKKQGALDLPAGESLTLSHAIIMQGGFADFADQKRVQITRPDGTGHAQKIVVDVAQILNGTSDRDPVLQRGDVILVPEKLINF